MGQQDASSKDKDGKKIDGTYSFETKSVKVSNTSPVTPSSVDDDTKNDISAESDRDYRKITSTIIDKTTEQLEQNNKEKNEFRKTFSKYIRWLLSIQFAVLCGILGFNHTFICISDTVITCFIVSVFVETLTGLIVMVKFAFDSTQEVELTRILNSIVQNFQKYPTHNDKK